MGLATDRTRLHAGRDPQCSDCLLRLRKPLIWRGVELKCGALMRGGIAVTVDPLTSKPRCETRRTKTR